MSERDVCCRAVWGDVPSNTVPNPKEAPGRKNHKEKYNISLKKRSDIIGVEKNRRKVEYDNE